MGRRDAVQFTLECAAEWRRLGALVTFEPGWETRGNGTSADYEGAGEHHTASPSSLARPFPSRSILIGGRTGLPGPLCNDATPVGPDDRPHIHVIAAHPANHAGASGGRGTAPLPVTSLFNPRSRGNEIDYAGTVPMSPGQRRAALIHGRGVVNVLGRGVEYVKAHAETSVTGKWDPGYANGKTIDMAAFRRDAANLSPEDDMPLTDADIGRILNFPAYDGGPSVSAALKRTEMLEPVPVKNSEGEDGPLISLPVALQWLDNNFAAIREGNGDTAEASRPPVAIDANAVAAALAANKSFVEAIAETTARKLADRLQS